MADGIAPALLAACAAVGAVYITQFVAEDYRRFRDASSLAAALAGELRSYKGGHGPLQTAFQAYIAAIESGRRGDLNFRPFQRPEDLVFEAMVSKIGLLGPDLVEGVTLVYGLLRAFRGGFETLISSHAEMTDAELIQRCQSCLWSLQAAYEKGEPLIQQLEARSRARFKPAFPW